ncbi:hypothetical protein OCB15_18080 [Bacillus cereus]|nr:hypothetical protein [Bacillus cereus]MEC3013898.1 hypothetical protein [Bacillus cereus]
MNTQQKRSTLTTAFRMISVIIAFGFGILAIMSFATNDIDNLGLLGGFLYLAIGIIAASTFMYMTKSIELKEATLTELRLLNEKGR